jgi:hypothetical protein
MVLLSNRKKTFIEQFVPKSLFERFGELSAGFIHPAIVDFVEDFQNFLGCQVTINDWDNGGSIQTNGWIPMEGNIDPANALQYAGASIRFKVEGISANEVFEAIIRLKMAGAFPGIKRLKVPDQDGFLCVDTFEVPNQERNSISVWGAK